MMLASQHDVMTMTWVCAKCEARAQVVGADPALPYGWTWQPYLSRRIASLQPGRVDVALGCCPQHALEAAKRYGTPVKAVPLED